MKITVERKKRSFAPVAMADIAFLLLIFFIVTVSIGDSPDVALPPFKYSKENTFPKTLVITVMSSGELLYEGNRINEKNLLPILQGLGKPEDFVINIMADQKTDYSLIDTLLQSLSSAKFQKIVLITGEKDENQNQ